MASQNCQEQKLHRAIDIFSSTTFFYKLYIILNVMRNIRSITLFTFELTKKLTLTQDGTDKIPLTSVATKFFLIFNCVT